MAKMTVGKLIKELQKYPKSYKIDMPFLDISENQLYNSELEDICAVEEEKVVLLINTPAQEYFMSDDCECEHCQTEQDSEGELN